MGYEVDQSGRIENSKTKSVFAIAGPDVSILSISAEAKRKLIKKLRSKYAPNLFYIQLFSSCLYILLKPYLKKKVHIILDTEYIGKNRQILKCLQILSNNSNFNCDIHFSHIGKSSAAHVIAITAYRNGKLTEEVKKIEAEELVSLVEKLNKK